MKSIFRIFSREEFHEYILKSNFSRPVRYIQNHHTWVPSYKHLTHARDEMYWLESMRTTHIRDRKWSDIGQNITTFPSGNIAVCRPINITPAGILGANTGAICIEHFGDFDTGGDTMAEEHKKSVIFTNAVLCKKFSLVPSTSSIVYHHWYDTNGKRFSDEMIDSGAVQRQKLQKSCPGTSFLSGTGEDENGNTVAAAKKNLIPLVHALLLELTQQPAPLSQPVQKEVTASKLNVRSGAGVTYPVVRSLYRGASVPVYETVEGWSRINANNEEWVSNQYLK